jgi:hypothetical protein
MNRYENHETSSHRVALGTAAVTISALAIGLLLVVPATITPACRDLRSSDTSPEVSAADQGNGGRLRVDVIGVREPSVAAISPEALPADQDDGGRLRVDVIGVCEPSVAAAQFRDVQACHRRSWRRSMRRSLHACGRPWGHSSVACNHPAHRHAPQQRPLRLKHRRPH